MKVIEKKKLQFVVVGLITFAGIEAWAVGPHNVSNTPHNLSSTSTYFQYASTDEDEVCIFCHTPHAASSDGALWNKALTGQTFTHYTSTTLSSAVATSRGATNVNTESLLCLTCHDGSISMYDVLNPSNRTGGQPSYNGMIDGGRMIMISGSAPIIDPVIGHGSLADGSVNDAVNNDLSNDHPISFSYDAARNDASDPTNVGAFQDATYAVNQGIKFFGAGNRVECSSCHDPHVDYQANIAYKPFLRMSNAQSGMCLACHIK